ncbi:hypothetical protein CDAR_477131 [Caerostris darwini]|uniref:Uncharacterized protein n=1 Tax=Caerostris darwini TaxID=1538125 RepID=A0AAV4U8A2_9ARAC|nr:hypothetical protein CDAR_477131 [Caerostris darwini]
MNAIAFKSVVNIKKNWVMIRSHGRNRRNEAMIGELLRFAATIMEGVIEPILVGVGGTAIFSSDYVTLDPIDCTIADEKYGQMLGTLSLMKCSKDSGRTRQFLCTMEHDQIFFLPYILRPYYINEKVNRQWCPTKWPHYPPDFTPHDL